MISTNRALEEQSALLGFEPRKTFDESNRMNLLSLLLFFFSIDTRDRYVDRSGIDRCHNEGCHGVVLTEERSVFNS